MAREFDSWQGMVSNIPAGTRVFLAGGTASIEVFNKRDDIFLCARALNVSGYENTATTRFLNAMPDADPDAEMALFTEYGIELLCCKNAGGDASVAKVRAARIIGNSHLVPGACHDTKRRAKCRFSRQCEQPGCKRF